MTDIFSDYTDPSRDLAKVRKIEVPNGAAFVLTQHDPHGFWKITREHGQIPARLSGEYTTISMAKQAVEAYIELMKKTIKETKEVK